MGHAHHFLSRLERVSDEHVELALSLYRDDQALRFILASVQIPERVERVAIAMGDTAQGPFLVVTREGRFVTCLGEGMTPNGLHVVPRSQLDALSQRVQVLRARLAQAERHADPDGRLTRLMKRVREAGDALTREEFEGLTAVQPLLQRHFLLGYYRAVETLADLRVALRGLGRPRPRDHAPLRAYWEALWAVNHLSLLVAADTPHALLEGLPEPVREGLLAHPTSWGAVRQGTLASTWRGSWMVGRLGKGVLPTYKRMHGTTPSITMTMCTTLGLVAIASRHHRLRAEVLKAMEPSSAEAFADQRIPAFHGMATAVIEAQLDGNDAFADTTLTPLRAAVFGALQRHPTQRARYACAEEIPRDVVLPLMGASEATWFDDADAMAAALTFFPILARVGAEQFYLREADMRGLHEPWTPERTLRLLRAYEACYGRKRPVVAVARPGRNEPCPCGSGQKYKRCCVAVAA